MKIILLIIYFVVNIILFFVLKYLGDLILMPKETIIYILLVLNGFIIFKSIKINPKKYVKSSKYGSHGTSEWLSLREIQKEYQEQKFGFLIGTTKEDDSKKMMFTRFVNEGGNGQVLVFGPPGSYKTTSFVLPNTSHVSSLDEKPDIIETDTKGEVIKIKLKELEKKGYEVFVLDFVNFLERDGINIFDFITEEQDILEISTAIKQIIYKRDDSKNGKYWEDSFYNFMIAIISILEHKKKIYEIERYSFKDIIENITMDYIFRNSYILKEQGGIALNAFMFIDELKNAKETAANVLTTIRTSLSVFSMKKIENTIGKTTCDINKLGRKVKFLKNKEQYLMDKKRVEMTIKELHLQHKKYMRDLFSVYYAEVERILQEQKEDINFEIFNPRKIKTFEDMNIFLETHLFYQETLNRIDGVKEAVVEKRNHLDSLYIRKIGEKEQERRDIISKLNSHKEKPMAIFILISDNDDTYAAPVNLILTTLMRTMYKTAREMPDGVALEKPVVGIIEEFCNIGKLDVIVKSLSTMRGRRIFFSMIIQSIPQLKRVYPNDFEEIYSMCDYKIVLGCADSKTAEVITKSLGQTTIKIQNESERKNTVPFIEKNGNISEVYSSRKLLFETELEQFDKKKGIVFSKGTKGPAIFFKSIERYWEE